MWRWIRWFLRDLFLHYFWGSICLIRRRHLDLAPIGDLGRKGFRGVPIYQCRRCMGFYLREKDAVKLGGKLP